MKRWPACAHSCIRNRTCGKFVRARHNFANSGRMVGHSEIGPPLSPLFRAFFVPATYDTARVLGSRLPGGPPHAL